MADTISVCFWKRDNESGFKNAEITSSHFQWQVSEAHFEEIHGLSRCVLLLADKLVTTFSIVLGAPLADHDFLINLLIDLIQHYEQIATLRADREKERLENIFRDPPDLELRWGEIPEAESGCFSILESIQLLIASLRTAQSQAFRDSENTYWGIAEGIARFADKINEVCKAYLNFVHPILIRSRRQHFREEEIDEREELFQDLLPHLRGSISRQLQGLRFRAINEP